MLFGLLFIAADVLLTRPLCLIRQRLETHLKATEGHTETVNRWALKPLKGQENQDRLCCASYLIFKEIMENQDRL